MKTSKTIDFIVSWIKNYKEVNRVNGFVVGVSGGIDSALNKHINWLKNKFKNVNSIDIDLTNVFNQFKSSVENNSLENKLALANSRSRIRMTTLYYYAGISKSIVVGTGNKVEDFGIGFYTKYGDGGVDISPIADLMKSEVFKISKALQINDEIIEAKPTDGLWDDDRSDEDQIGATYNDLELIMNILEKGVGPDEIDDELKEKYNIYIKHHTANKHKMIGIPICKIPKELKS